MSTSNTTMKSTNEQRRRAKNESKKLRNVLMNKGKKRKAKAIKQNYHNQFLKKKIIYKLKADTI
jgi:hypothetical protein